MPKSRNPLVLLGIASFRLHLAPAAAILPGQKHVRARAEVGGSEATEACTALPLLVRAVEAVPPAMAKHADDSSVLNSGGMDVTPAVAWAMITASIFSPFSICGFVSAFWLFAFQ